MAVGQCFFLSVQEVKTTPRQRFEIMTANLPKRQSPFCATTMSSREHRRQKAAHGLLHYMTATGTNTEQTNKCGAKLPWVSAPGHLVYLIDWGPACQPPLSSLPTSYNASAGKKLMTTPTRKAPLPHSRLEPRQRHNARSLENFCLKLGLTKSPGFQIGNCSKN